MATLDLWLISSLILYFFMLFCSWSTYRLNHVYLETVLYLVPLMSLYLFSSITDGVHFDVVRVYLLPGFRIHLDQSLVLGTALAQK